jgi:NAD(P)H-dependent FMN reductase
MPVPFGNKEFSMANHRVGYFVGSLSSTSINRQLAKALVRLAPKGIQIFVTRVLTVLPRES